MDSRKIDKYFSIAYWFRFHCMLMPSLKMNSHSFGYFSLLNNKKTKKQNEIQEYMKINKEKSGNMIHLLDLDPT